MTGTYSYYYDAFGRRRAKATPLSTKDEYFYDLGVAEDDYIWLGGRPVLIVRGKFSAASTSQLEPVDVSYQETFTVWLLRSDFEIPAEGESWDAIPALAIRRLGEIPASRILFDKSLRHAVDAEKLSPLLDGVALPKTPNATCRSAD